MEINLYNFFRKKEKELNKEEMEVYFKFNNFLQENCCSASLWGLSIKKPRLFINIDRPTVAILTIYIDLNDNNIYINNPRCIEIAKGIKEILKIQKIIWIRNNKECKN